MTTATAAHPRADHFDTSDGVRLRVLDEGPTDASVTVVLPHGWTLTARTWDRVVEGIGGAVGSSVRTIRFDLRGHGESDAAPAGTGTIERCTDDLAELLAERVPHGPLVLAGHSMGGMMLMALAERHPALFAERVSAVAFVASAPGDLAKVSLGLPKPLAEAAHVLEMAAARLLVRSRGARLSRRSTPLRPGLRWMLFGRRPERAAVQDTARWVADCQPRALAEFRWSLAEHDRLHALAGLDSVPTLVLAGFGDRLTPYRHAQRMGAALPTSRLIGYGGAGHMLPLERSAEVTQRLAELIRPVLGRDH